MMRLKGYVKLSDPKRRSRVQENLFNLYLRLNGFFVTGFIVHSPIQGQNRAEIDALAVRHPYNDEPERVIKPSSYIRTSQELIDLLVCEVKSRGQQLCFNESLRDSIPAIESVLRWAGLFCEKEVQALAPQVQAVLQPSDPPKQDIPSVPAPRKTRIRAILGSPGRWNRHGNQPWFINGSEIFEYLWQCFCPEKPRDSCSTRYDFGLWGESYEPLVKYFKERGQEGAGKLTDLYRYLGI
jgi:hypothetical protein